MLIERRRFLTGLVGLVAAPAVIRTPGLLMPVRPWPDDGWVLGTKWWKGEERTVIVPTVNEFILFENSNDYPIRVRLAEAPGQIAFSWIDLEPGERACTRVA